MACTRICSLTFLVIASRITRSDSVGAALGAIGPIETILGASAGLRLGIFKSAQATFGVKAATGAVAAGTAAAGAATTAAAGAATTGAAVTQAAGPLGWLISAAGPNSVYAHVANPSVLLPLFGAGAVVVGAEAGASAVTWDCWKPILHETSLAPSRGRLLTDILSDPVISDYKFDDHAVFVRNRWNESWRIDPVLLPWGQLAAHASQMLASQVNVSASLGGSQNS
eukprot:TRINITY_DN1035_c0_g1_i1.p1 TRINITY_DN1035_c0_g1~~TRINITY_DN1035_c0_g1_i1.p1  ORF type:complete len:226 (+),score=28.44 TRINITY_DN1035_c0_g1_i1:62-739(+)